MPGSARESPLPPVICNDNKKQPPRADKHAAALGNMKTAARHANASDRGTHPEF